MTPKEKAQDLVNRYRAILMNENTDCGEEILCTTIAKNIALDVVDEIMSALLYPKIPQGMLLTVIYYDEVKQEIENL